MAKKTKPKFPMVPPKGPKAPQGTKKGKGC